LPREIAIFSDENRETASVYDPGTITVYQKAQGSWEISRQQAFCLDKGLGIKGLRKSMLEALKFLADCKIFIGRSVVGIPYFEFEKAGCSVWEFEGNSQELLDYVWEQEFETQKRENNPSTPVIPLPIETSPGFYRISLKEIQKANTEITSKQALLPFLRKAAFDNLEVLCTHVPPWLEAELIIGNLSGETTKIGRDEVKVSIRKQSRSLG